MLRRALLKGLGASALLGACQHSPHVYDMQVSRDAGCPCCHVWAELMEKTGRFRIAVIDGPDLPAYNRRVGVPEGLGACHTALVDGLVIEGHVPSEDVLRLLAERPAGVKGIAVPGMPRGSPGMEQPNGVVDPYETIAFGDNGQSVFAKHGPAPV